jgi:hypothetical protein
MGKADKFFVILLNYGKKAIKHMINKQARFTLITLAALLANGCASNTQPASKAPALDIVGPLAKSASLVHEDLMLLNNLRQANSVYPVEHLAIPKGELGQKMSLSWSGPAHEPVKMIAKTLGWEYRVVGRRPADPLFVHIRAVNQPVFSVIEDIGTQMGTRAGIELNEVERLIVVDYRPAPVADRGRTWHQ